jgi:hypothetical protein
MPSEDVLHPEIDDKGVLLRLSDNQKTENMLRSLYDHVKYEAEYIHPSGSYWGEFRFIELDNATYLYFKAKERKLEEDLAVNELKYNFRSMPEMQKTDSIEIMIDTSQINEVMNKNFLCNPIAIEIFHLNTNRMYFFNMFQESNRQKLLSKLRM